MKKRLVSLFACMCAVVFSASAFGGCKLVSTDNDKNLAQIIATVQISENAKAENIYTIPMGIDYIYFSQAQNNIDNNILTFVGNMNYAPNHASVIDICDKLLPNIKSSTKYLTKLNPAKVK